MTFSSWNNLSSQNFLLLQTSANGLVTVRSILGSLEFCHARKAFLPGSWLQLIRCSVQRVPHDWIKFDFSNSSASWMQLIRCSIQRIPHDWIKFILFEVISLSERNLTYPILNSKIPHENQVHSSKFSLHPHSRSDAFDRFVDILQEKSRNCLTLHDIEFSPIRRLSIWTVQSWTFSLWAKSTIFRHYYFLEYLCYAPIACFSFDQLALSTTSSTGKSFYLLASFTLSLI